MVATLRVVLDQVAVVADRDLAAAARDLTDALVATTPDGCQVEALVPAGGEDAAREIAGIAQVKKLALPRRELVAAWQAGIAPAAGGMIHSPSLLAPLVKHDRVHDLDQTVVTVWDLRPWLAPTSLPKSAVGWQKAMLKRAVKHADAVVVPTHAHAERLADLTKLGGRIRVIAGAPPADSAVPFDAASRTRGVGLPADYVLIGGLSREDTARGLGAAADALDADTDLAAVVFSEPAGDPAAVGDLAAAVGIPERRLHVVSASDDADRRSIVSGARVFIEPTRSPVFPWLAIEALALGTPIVAPASPVVSELIAEGGLIIGDVEGPLDGSALSEAVTDAATDSETATRLRVLAADRARSFSWLSSAEKVWQLHADL